MGNVKLTNSQQVLVTSASAVNILPAVVGLRDSLMLQNKGDDTIEIFFTQQDLDNGYGWELNSKEWIYFDIEKLQNALWVKAVNADCTVIFQANSPKV